MLKPEDAVWSGKYKTYTSQVFQFACSKCGNTILVPKTRLNKHSGLCTDCNRRLPKNAGKPYEWLFNRLHVQARLRGIEVGITYEEFLEFTEIPCCRYCNSPITWTPHSKHGHSAINFDRLDNDKGYIRGNIGVCCYNCNTRKSNWLSADEFQAVHDFLKLRKTLSHLERKELDYTILSWKDALTEVRDER